MRKKLQKKSNIFFQFSYNNSEAVSFNCSYSKVEGWSFMFENHSSCMWILVILFVVLNCNSCLEDKCEASCGCGNKPMLGGFSPILLVAVFFLFFKNGHEGFCC